MGVERKGESVMNNPLVIIGLVFIGLIVLFGIISLILSVSIWFTAKKQIDKSFKHWDDFDR